MRHLLFIDDNELLGKTLRLILGKKYRFTICHTGLDGLRAAIEAVPDAILCDLALPDMSGTEVVRELQSNPLTQALPIIIVTGSPVADGSIDEAICVLRKPFTADELDTALTNAATPVVEAMRLPQI